MYRRSAGARRGCGRGVPGGAFTLIEMLVVVAIVAVLLGVLLPALSQARAQARSAVCASNLKQLATAALMYASDNRSAMPPLAWPEADPPIYWWGTNDPKRVDHTASPLYRYLRSDLAEGSVFECPAQPWGTYRPQGAAGQVTSTYGYNGYYLSPAATPGWARQIRHRPWRRTGTIEVPALVFMFADTLYGSDADSMPKNNALLDPPYLYVGRHKWVANAFPTTAFRHRGRTNAACCDGHVESFTLEGGRLTSERHGIGYVGRDNFPHYVPDWQKW